MKANKLFDKIISLCYDIENQLLANAILPIEDERGDSSKLVNLLEEVMLILNDIRGEDAYTDELIGEIEELYAELYEM